MSRKTTLIACLVSLLSVWGCGSDVDGGAEACASQVIQLQCPAGAVAKLATQASGSCSGSASADFINNSGELAGSCQSQGSCDFVCEVEDLSVQCGGCGIQSISSDAIVCNTGCGVCGDGLCTESERDSGDCPADCAMGQVCVPGTAQCRGNQREICRPDGLDFDLVDCPSGQTCQGDGMCVTATCDDMVSNGNESGVDCGGDACPPCGDNQACRMNTDCESGVCDAATSTCSASTCTDGVLNGPESDVDCGGTCPNRCADRQLCNTNADCESTLCGPDGRCASADCFDMEQNGNESDIDCGGGSCMPCADTLRCNAPTDCASMVCTMGACSAPTCFDTVQNGTETDADCGGATCDPCFGGGGCMAGGDCRSGSCPNGTCDPLLCGADQRVENNLCVMCPVGETNMAGDDASGADTLCDDACSLVLGVRCPEYEEAYIKASNPDANDNFATVLALSGDTLVVGAPREDSNSVGVNSTETDNSVLSAGAAYVFVRSGTTWSQQAYIKSSNPEFNDGFGSAVAIDGDTIVISAPGEDSNGVGVNPSAQNNNSATDSGAVYVFVRSGTTWSQQAYIKAANPNLDDEFGDRVAIDGDTIVVGAHQEDSSATGINTGLLSNSASNSGAVYVFTRSSTTWSQEAYIKASNTDASDTFGRALAISGDTLAVGAPLEDSRACGINGDESDNSEPFRGAVYVFVRSSGTWSQQAYVKQSQPGGDQFGTSVDLDGDTLAVGAPADDSSDTGVNANQIDNGASNSGAVYVFTRSGTTWSQQTFIKASNTDAMDSFGQAITLDGNRLAVGARTEDSNATGIDGNQSNNAASNSGAVYLFTRDAGNVWSQQAYIKASNTDGAAAGSTAGAPGDSFGTSLDLDGTTLIVGAPSEDSAAAGINGDQTNNTGDDTGAAYIRIIAP